MQGSRINLIHRDINDPAPGRRVDQFDRDFRASIASGVSGDLKQAVDQGRLRAAGLR
jgi:hypothetical protein